MSVDVDGVASRRRRMRAKWLVAAAVSAAVLLTMTGCGVAVPNSVGMKLDQAAKVLKTDGFGVGAITYDPQAAVPGGSVVAQEPIAGDSVRAGSRINLTVAGPPPVAMPALVGLVRADAEAGLSSAGLKMGTVTEVYDASAPAGTVMSQTPAAGTVLTRASAVAVVVSKGPVPVPVPQVKGLTQADATKVMQDAGFVVTVKKAEDEAEKDIVIAQEPDGGEAQPGSTVVLTVSKGTSTSAVPELGSVPGL